MLRHVKGLSMEVGFMWPITLYIMVMLTHYHLLQGNEYLSNTLHQTNNNYLVPSHTVIDESILPNLQYVTRLSLNQLDHSACDT